MLEKLLSSVIVKLLMKLLVALKNAALLALMKFKRSKAQEKATDALQEKTDANAPREEKRQSEEDYINS